MRKQGAILILAAFLALILCSAVSAADSSDDGGVLLDQVQDVDESVLLVDQSSQSVIDPVITLGVNYEYSSDGGINPAIDIKDSAGVGVEFTKSHDSSDKVYNLTFDYPDVADGSTFKVIVSAPGYVTEEQEVTVIAGTDGNFRGQVNFNLEATAAYKLGREVTKKADQLLKFSTADDVLCITTAGLAYLDGTTTEDCLEGVLNASNGLISYGQGNLLTFQSARTDPLEFCFVVRKGDSLTAAFFKNGSLTPAYKGTFSAINQNSWDNTIVPIFGDKAFGYVSLANAWKEGLSTDILRQAAYHGHVCLGTISGQAMISLLLKYYPPGVYGDDGELEATSYRAIGVPGNSDDDAFIYSLDLTPGKRSYVGYDTAEDNMVGFIRWCATTNTGTLIIMAFDEDAVIQKYKNETGRTAYAGIESELKFNSWLVDQLENDPDSLVKILYVFDDITEEVHNNLTGGVDSKNVVVDALGLDMDYILGLGLTNIADQRVATTYLTGNLTQEQIKQIGIEAANMAIALFAADGITLEKDDPNLTVFTTAGYVRVKEQVMDMTMDGIYQILGSRLSRATLLPVHNARFNPLYFQFSLEKGGEVISKTIYYDAETGALTAANKSPCSISGVILYDPPYDALMAWLWHNHICGGSSPGYLLTNYIYETFPLSEDEQYALISNSVSCRCDIYSYLLGISAGSGTYYSQRMTKDSTGSEILTISVYDSKTNTRRVAIIDWTGPKFAEGSNSYEEYIRLYKGDYSSPNLISAPVINLAADTWVTEEEWNAIISGGEASGNALNYIKSLPVRTKEELIQIQGGTETPNDGSDSPGPSTGSDGSNSLPTGSVGDSGLAMTATLQATATEAGQEPGSTSTAHEITPVTSESTSSSSWGVAAIVGVLVVLALGAFGFFWKGRGSA